eukprot:6075463-Lingulodinium_polyedra.AAC.1
MAFNGKQQQDLEDEITLLKGCTLLGAMGEREICKKVVLEALNELNEGARRRLNAQYPAGELRAADFSGWAHTAA